MKLKNKFKKKFKHLRFPFNITDVDRHGDIRCVKWLKIYLRELKYQTYKFNAELELPKILKHGRYAGKYFRFLKKYVGIDNSNIFDRSRNVPGMWFTLDDVYDLYGDD